MTPTSSVYVLEITEHERGWGVRPDGYYIFENKAAADQFLTRELAGRTGPVPDEYESYSHVGYRAVGLEFQRMLEVTKASRVHIRQLSELER
jgi:hypothetical protein